jgi:hypothetical protein
VKRKGKVERGKLVLLLYMCTLRKVLSHRRCAKLCKLYLVYLVYLLDTVLHYCIGRIVSLLLTLE